MKTTLIIAVAFSTFIIISSSPYDDGKYYPKKYRLDGFYNDGRYHRPSNEGKYIPGDEGRYTYIYRQFIDGDYRYIHREGPQGPGGDYGGDYGTYAEKYRYIHKVGPNGPNGGFGSGNGLGYGGRLGPKGPHGPGGFGSNGQDEDWFECGNEAEGSENYYTKMTVTQLKSVVCSNIEDKNNTLLLKRIPDELDDSGQRFVSLYKMKGTKKVKGDIFANGKNLAFEYEIIVSVIEEPE